MTPSARVPHTIRLLEDDANKRGDLFERLVTDLFSALGYEDFRLNVQKSGREVDIKATHRRELRSLRAECKATAEKVGGDDINKFVGALDAERRTCKGQDIIGYFVSIAGFRETALQQEQDAGGQRLVLMDAGSVIEELIKGNMVVSPAQAMERAGRCAARAPMALRPDPSCELLAHACGFIWTIRFTLNKQPSHFTLVHADGEALSADLAREIVEADRRVGGTLGTLQYLAPGADDAPSDAQIEAVRARYFEYISTECSEIQLDGLPADEDVGARRLRIESLFVPLRLTPTYLERSRPVSDSDVDAVVHLLFEEPKLKSTHLDDLAQFLGRKKILPHGSFAKSSNAEEPQRQLLFLLPDLYTHDSLLPKELKPFGGWLKGRFLEARPLGKALAERSRMAVLGPPGAGKSTLLKSLAVAYAFPERRPRLDEHLPDRPWLPILIRCRELGELVGASISSILASIPGRALLEDTERPAFAALLRQKLRAGEMLLLIDGLDEIVDDGKRTAFVRSLRSFLSMYPSVGVVLTSREAGFRIVGGALTSQCSHFRLTEFDDQDVRRLVVAWYREVVGDRPSVKADAERLADTILSNDRIRRLASNPLLLTTLLLVNRWVGQLPTKRSVLYDKAIEVLLMTWNVEAHGKLDPEEVVPQLAFVAFSMMKKGTQRISGPALREELQRARDQMPDVLAYAKLGVGDLIQRVEYRSSLLVQVGQDLVDGQMRPLYEFRHLTFQEYLAALAAAKKYYPAQDETETIATVLAPHWWDEAWREVIPLAAVLAGRDAKLLIEELIRACESQLREWTGAGPPRGTNPATLLERCLRDEIQIPPPLVERALRTLLDLRVTWVDVRPFARGRYRDVVQAVVEDLCRSLPEGFRHVESLSSLAEERIGIAWDTPVEKLHDEVLALFDSDDPLRRAAAAKVTGSLFRPHYKHKGELLDLEMPEHRRPIAASLLQRLPPLLEAAEPIVQYAAIAALNDVSTMFDEWIETASGALTRLVALWLWSEWGPVRQMASQALFALPLDRRPPSDLAAPDPTMLDALVQLATASDPPDKLTLLAVAYFLRRPWSDDELAARVASFHDAPSRWKTAMLEALGPAGAAYRGSEAPGERDIS